MVYHDPMDRTLTPREVAELLPAYLNTLKGWSDRERIAAYRINPRVTEDTGYLIVNAF